MRHARLPAGLWKRIGFLSCLVSLAAPPVAADDIAQVTSPPPAIYQEKLAPLLTPAEDVLKHPEEYAKWNGDGVILLDEVVTYVNDDGRRTMVFHVMEKALNDAGVRSLAQDSFSYKKKMQRTWLVMARTIQPDGTKLPVKNDAIFLKTPQSEDGDSIYNDQLDVVTVYSGVKPGSVTESITILEDTEPKVAGQYTQTYGWVGSWPCYQQRFTINVSTALAARLKITNLGQGVPDFTTTDAAGNRKLYTWTKPNTDADPPDGANADHMQIGPMLWLSTMPGWDTFAAWYNAQARGTDQLSPELKEKIDGWTNGLTDPKQILCVLQAHAAQDIRYTGFELGRSDLQPHTCTSVWERQYGDCKDKANLLRSMLEYKNIPAWLVLLNTEYAGAVFQGSPDYRQFNHCIVQAQVGDQPVFCDPTITYGVPGLLNGSESNRDVLVIKGDQAVWAHTPPFHDATVAYNFDLQIKPSGELAGWLEMKATGYYAAGYWKDYKDMTREQRLSQLRTTAKAFFPTCDVADVESLPPAPTPDALKDGKVPDFSVRAYVVQPGVLNQADASSELKFPGVDSILPDLSDYKTRSHATFLWTDHQEVTAKIALPDGWNASALPLPASWNSDSGELSASWASDKNVLTARAGVSIKQSLLPPDQMKALGDTMNSFRSWASKSLTLVRSKDAPAPAAPRTDAELAANLPLMPTGDGQLNLIDTEFPRDGNTAARREALKRIPAQFPADKKAIVGAAIRIAALDLTDKNWKAMTQLQPVVDANRSALDPDTLAWADYLSACGLQGQDKKDAALAIFRRIVNTSAVDANRRGWAVYRCVSIMGDKSPAAALDLAEANMNLESDAMPSVYAVYAQTAISSKQNARLKERLTKLITAKPENLEDILLQIADTANTLATGDKRQQGLDLVAVLESVSSPAVTGDALARALRSTREEADSAATYAKLQQDLKQLLTQFPDIAELEKKQPAFSSIADASRSLDQHETNSEPDESLGCALRIATGYPPDSKFPEYIWQVFTYDEWSMRLTGKSSREDFFFKVAALADALPHDSDAYNDIRLLQGKQLEKKNQRAEAQKIYDALMANPDLPDTYRGPVALRAGMNAEEMGNYARALECDAFGQKMLDEQVKAQTAQLHAIFIQLDNGNQVEALKLSTQLAQATDRNRSKPDEQVDDFVSFVRGATDPPAYWNNWQSWWPQWQQIESTAGLDPVPKDRKVIPGIPSMVDLGKDLGSAKNEKNARRFFEVMRPMAYAARDYPNAALEFVGVFSLAEDMLPNHDDDFRRLAIAILEPLTSPVPKQQRTRIMHLLANYIDSNQAGKALELMARDWQPSLADESAVTVSIHRLWALAALRQHQDLDTVRQVLETDLKSPNIPNRAKLVISLAEIQAALGHKDQAEQLIEAELVSPAIAASPEQQQVLKDRLATIRNVSDAASQLARGVQTWQQQLKLPWWDFAEPKSPNDPRLARLETILSNPGDTFQPAEMIKAGLLAPSLPALDAFTQQQGIDRSFAVLLGHCTTQSEAEALTQQVLDNNSFPLAIKTRCLFVLLWSSAYEGHIASMEKFRKSLYYPALSADEKANLDRRLAFSRVDHTSSTVLIAYAQDLEKHPLDRLDVDLIRQTVDFLLRDGDLDAAQTLYQSITQVDLTADSKISKTEFQLTLLKQINAAKRLAPVFEAFRKATLATSSADAIAKPAGYDQRHNLDDLSDLAPADATAWRLYLIKQHQQPASIAFWEHFMHDQKPGPATNVFNLGLLQAALASGGDDDLTASLILIGAESVDIDDPDVRQKFLDLAKPFRDTAKYPQSAEIIRLLTVGFALRQGQPANLETDLSGFTSPVAQAEALRLKLRAGLQAHDVPRLKTVLDNLSAEQLVSPHYLTLTLPALVACGMNDEAALARDTLKHKLYEDILTAWFAPTGPRLESVTNDLLALGDTHDVPPAFTDFVAHNVARAQEVSRYQLVTATLNNDWQTAATIGTAYVHDYPTYYSEYWFLGRAQSELGRKAEAIQTLTVYCRYSHDEVWSADARNLLDKLNGAPK